MSLENICTKDFVDALSAIRTSITLKEAIKILESGDYYFPDFVENDRVVITDFKVDSPCDFEYFESIEPQEVFIFVGNYVYPSFESNKYYYFISYEEFQELCKKALAFVNSKIEGIFA